MRPLLRNGRGGTCPEDVEQWPGPGPICTVVDTRYEPLAAVAGPRGEVRLFVKRHLQIEERSRICGTGQCGW